MEQNSRQNKITQTAILGIIANLFIATIKIIIGMAASSLAIITEGINNATDCGSALMTLIGTKLSAKHPDEKHPFGYGRIEYLTGMVVGVFILYAGISMIRESIDGIIHPTEMSVSLLTIGIIAFTAIIKFVLGIYTIGVGKQTNSDTLIAVGEDGRNDSFISLITIISSIIFLMTGISIDAYAGLLFSFVVIKSGIDVLKSTASDIIGTSGEEELAKALYKEIRSTEGIISAADMMLHNYGPDQYSGSVNIEIDHKKNVGEVYEFIHELQLRIMHEYKVTMVFGIYAVDRDSEQSKEMRSYIAKFVKSHEHIKSFHALYLSEKTGTIYCDFIVDYDLHDWEGTQEEFLGYMGEKYPDYKIELTIETDFV